MITATEKHFNARITEFVHGTRYDYYKFINTDTDEHREVPEWCLLDFVELPSNMMDDGHIKVGSELQMRETAEGKFLPGYIYKRKPSAGKRTQAKILRMSEESVFEGSILYKQYSSKDLWDLFAQKCSEAAFTPEQILAALQKKGCTDEEQAAFLKGILGIDNMNIGVQEGSATEFKSSFIHPANRVQSERSIQLKEIFKELVSMANNHTEGYIYIGVKNNGEVSGIENELLNEVPFSNRADFVADLKNQLNIACGNYEFTSTVTFSWFRTEDRKLFCRINLPKWCGNVLLLNGTELYVRDEARKVQLKGTDLINYIIRNCSTAA